MATATYPSDQNLHQQHHSHDQLSEPATASPTGTLPRFVVPNSAMGNRHVNQLPAMHTTEHFNMSAIFSQPNQFTRSNPSITKNNSQYLQTHLPERRPTTAASVDTYHQAQTLFDDFDGTHYAPSIREPDNIQRDGYFPIARPRYSVAAPAAGMVYYPAPVPLQINLPQKLATARPDIEARRRTQVLSTINPDIRKSAVWLNEDEKLPQDLEQDNITTPNIPAQLRASVFFDRSSPVKDIEIQDQSASHTLEALLNASANAPVSAFTGHIFGGEKAANIYKRDVDPKRLTSMPVITAAKTMDTTKSNRLSSLFGFGRRDTGLTGIADHENPTKTKRRFSRSFSLGAKLDDSALSRDPNLPLTSASVTSLPVNETADHDDDENDGTKSEPALNTEYDTRDEPPTTLLAEIEYRKKALKSRNLTALDAFPNGMHTTLLELDAVRQVQKDKRNKTRVHLAWESSSKNELAIGEAEDDDVPLAVLLSKNARTNQKSKSTGIDDAYQPGGLLQQREMEDNEPLSFRRARLKGIEVRQSTYMPLPINDQLDELNFDLDSPPDVDSEEFPEETLAERKARLTKIELESEAPKHTDDKKAFEGTVVPEFDYFMAIGADQNPVESQIRKAEGDQGEGKRHARAEEQDEEEEETLAQRRARLQREKESTPLTSPSFSNPRKLGTPSMGDLLGQTLRRPTYQTQRSSTDGEMKQKGLLGQSQIDQLARKQNIRKVSGGLTSINATDIENSLDPNVREQKQHASEMDHMQRLKSAYEAAMASNNQASASMLHAEYLSMQNRHLLSMMLGISPYAPQNMEATQATAWTGDNNMSQYKRQSEMMGMMHGSGPKPPILGPQVYLGQGPHDFLDNNNRQRIENWRSNIQDDE